MRAAALLGAEVFAPYADAKSDDKSGTVSVIGAAGVDKSAAGLLRPAQCTQKEMRIVCVTCANANFACRRRPARAAHAHVCVRVRAYVCVA